MSDFPPLYTPTSLPTPLNLPQYTEYAAEHERTLTRTSEPSSPVIFTLSHTRHCVYQTDHLEIDFGRFPSALAYPAYGYNGVVEGKVRFKKGCSYVVKVIVKLEGIVTTTATEYARVAVPSISKVILVSRVSTLVSGSQFTSKGHGSISAGSEYPFSIPFPSTIDGQTVALPPTFTAVQPGISIDVAYCIQVEVLRKGIFRGREVRKIPILYLPKSRPPVASLLELPYPSLASLPNRVAAVQLAPVWPKTCQSRSLSESVELPLIHLLHPLPRHYASGEYIPLGINIACPSSPALTQLYLSDICVQLVKRRMAWFGPTRQVATKDTVISTADVVQKIESQHGENYLSFRLKAGQCGREASWKVEGVIEVYYFIRVAVRPQQRHLPKFEHEETVQLTTDSYDMLEVETIEGGISEPALGLTTLTHPAAPPGSSQQSPGVR